MTESYHAAPTPAKASLLRALEEKHARERAAAERTDFALVAKVEDRESAREPGGAPEWPKPLGSMDKFGLAGEIVTAIEPHSEADPAALLTSFLVAFGNAIGRKPFFAVEGDRHHMNMFAALVGRTSKGRKGTSWGRVRSIFDYAAPDWSAERVVSGLSTGEGLIHVVRDPIMGKDEDGEPKEIDPGVEDKRLCVVESEFARVLKVMARDVNTLSPTLRQAWDAGDLRTVTKGSAERATGAHVSFVAHVVAEELRRLLTASEAAGGFANRFLWVCVKRSKILPEGGTLAEGKVQEIGARLANVIRYASKVGEIVRDVEARDRWHEAYPALSAGASGMFGTVTSRAEAQVTRLSALFALLAESTVIRLEHLDAALEVWRYCEDSARWVWGTATGDALVDEILRYLTEARTEGRTRTDISNFFSRNRSSSEIAAALELLHESKKAEPATQQTGGRPREVWYAAEFAPESHAQWIRRVS